MPVEAVLFPGQGIGVKQVKEFYGKLHKRAPEVTDRYISYAQEALNNVHGSEVYQIQKALEGETHFFNQTEFYQPVVCALSLATFEYIRNTSRPFVPAYMTGHSLGEWTAVIAAAGVSHKKGLEIVAWRGRFMQKASGFSNSGLVSISAVDLEEVENLCRSDKKLPAAKVALINSPKSFVVGCSRDMIPVIIERAKDTIARVVDLKLAGAFHTEYMEKAAEELSEKLKEYKFRKIRFPIVANLSGRIVEKGEIYPLDNLIKSMTRPVQWVQIMETLKGVRVDLFREVGPGAILLNLCHYNDIPKSQLMGIFGPFRG